MALNKNALIRYKTIDKCLQNNNHQWTLDKLIEACSDALYEYEGKDTHVSKRTVQLDIQMMRSDKLGYNAPIVVYDRKYYKYESPDFSITDIPLTENDMSVLSETVEMLKQFKDFSLFTELGGIIQRLEDKVYTEKTKNKSIIHMDRNENLKGLHFLDELYQAILKKVVLKLDYKSFKAKSANIITFHPYILKEFNNRWFLIGKRTGARGISNLALDRIISIDYDFKLSYFEADFDPDQFYKNVIGVTVNQGERPTPVNIYINAYNAPYVITKPLHHSQILQQQNDDGSIIISIKVKINFELERLLLGFGESIEILQPERLRKRIVKRLNEANELYL
ncbi:putative DNA-binding transcriptional regulator YafY [Aquimarina sp. MAR_2010_214]|uniref:helix-turn-helix transcriptional regulator n=1 Tax=Aquimarina sp. MAR_2010_214 TaxID=1250026 RepID=UPI000C7115AB|nr:WYL domain-containing protein [Aquimarina sp. MAR_2010_214]PKV48096.1 putative DNA-binding transcriptional regulator YafY [Aquimarina sp. MAR_2010_214]